MNENACDRCIVELAEAEWSGVIDVRDPRLTSPTVNSCLKSTTLLSAGRARPPSRPAPVIVADTDQRGVSALCSYTCVTHTDGVEKSPQLVRSQLEGVGPGIRRL